MQVLGDEGVRLIPADRCVVLGTGPQHHRLGQTSLLGQPILGFPGEFGDGIFGEELARHRAAGGLLGDGFGAVLAEFGEFAAAGLLRPGAPGAVEAVSLVDFGPRRDGAYRAHLGQAAPQRHQNRRDPGGGSLGRAHPHRAFLVPATAHASNLASGAGHWSPEACIPALTPM